VHSAAITSAAPATSRAERRIAAIRVAGSDGRPDAANTSA